MLKHQFDDSLAHFGVKGMRWGVRKKTTRKPRKSISEMSNDELQEAITRGNLERQYAALQPQSGLARIGGKYRNKLEENAMNVASKITVNAVMGVMDYGVSRLKDPDSLVFTEHGDKIYNVYRNYIWRR